MSSEKFVTPVTIKKGFEHIPFSERKSLGDLTPEQQARYQHLKDEADKWTEKKSKSAPGRPPFGQFKDPIEETIHNVHGIKKVIATTRLDRFEREVGFTPHLVEPASEPYVSPIDRAQGMNRAALADDKRATRQEKQEALYGSRYNSLNDRLRYRVGIETATQKNDRKDREKADVSAELAGDFTSQYQHLIEPIAKKEMDIDLKYHRHREAA